MLMERKIMEQVTSKENQHLHFSEQEIGKTTIGTPIEKKNKREIKHKEMNK